MIFHNRLKRKWLVKKSCEYVLSLSSLTIMYRLEKNPLNFIEDKNGRIAIRNRNVMEIDNISEL